MKQTRDASHKLILAGVLLAAPLVAGLVMAAIYRHPAAVVGVIAGLVAAAGVALLARILNDDLLVIAQQIEDNGETGAVDGPATALLTGRAVTVAAARVHRRLLNRALRAEAAAAADDGVIESLHDPLLLCDATRRVTRANRAARHLFGEKMAGRDLAGAIRAPDVLTAADSVLAGAASRSVEFATRAPVERTFEARLKPFTRPAGVDEDGPEDRRMIIITLHDISAIRRSEQMRADFIANASHELRTPLSSLIGFIETLRGPARDDADAHERFLAIMEDQASRMSRLVKDLLSLSRIELDEHMPPSTAVAMEPLVRGVLDSLELKAQARRMVLALEAESRLPDVIGDSDQIVQVVQNLVSNAIKYGHDDSPVTVRLSLADGATVGASATAAGRGGGRRLAPGMLAVAVTDCGDGIPRTHLPRLTERFYRVDAARSRAMGGTGLGLAIVKHIMNRHRGRLTIESAPGVGSTFTVYFPVATETMMDGQAVTDVTN